jgi:predicted nuclease with TOPRIM domain
MTNGERLLQDHAMCRRRYEALETRIAHCRAEIERVMPMDTPQSGNQMLSWRERRNICGDADEEIAGRLCSYAQENWEMQERLKRLEEKLQPLQDALNLYDSIMAGLDSQEAWLVCEYYEKRRTLEDLAAEQVCAKSTMLARKRKMLEKVDALLEELCLDVNQETRYELSI